VAELLANHTTLRVGGPVADFVVADTEADLIEAVRDADSAGKPLLVLGGGSNVLVSDSGFDGRAVAGRPAGVHSDADACGGAVVRVAAGESWDALVTRAVGEGWVGVEALAGIPGLVGATPIQNVGAYGEEVSQTIASVRCWDRQAGEVRTLFNRDCRFGYRTSRLKQEPSRWVVLEVVFQLRLGDLGTPVAYAELARRLEIDLGGRAPLADVRAAVFFTNPVLAPEDVPEGAPAWPQPDGRVKTSAAWLIEQAGFERGHGNDRAALSGKHTLALTNRGGATATDLVTLAREVRDGVRARFGIELVNEPVLVGCAL
jgi:UDP-N-acetylmuramate dehydrogenase